MRYPKRFLNIFDLTQMERRVLGALERTPQLASEIQRKTNIPRATLDRVLKELHRRNLLAKRKHSARRGGWVGKQLEEIETEFRIKLIAENREIFVYHGKDAMLKAVHRFIETYAGERTYAVQSNKAWDVWHEKLGLAQFKKVNDSFREKMVIIEAVFPERLSNKIFNGYENRPSIAHVLPEEYFNFYSDLMICKDIVFIMNWKDEIAVEIHNKDLISLFLSLFKYFQDTGRRINLHNEARTSAR